MRRDDRKAGHKRTYKRYPNVDLLAFASTGTCNSTRHLIPLAQARQRGFKLHREASIEGCRSLTQHDTTVEDSRPDK
ncbi:hypothetical protein M3J09_012047 [Ascochyta lentis]